MPKKSKSSAAAASSAQPSVQSSAPPAASVFPFEVRTSAIQGRGVFATRQIRKGKKLIEYVGEPISHKESERRYDDSNGRHHTFLFVLNDDIVLDARTGGNDARFINHSCEPNCETEIDDDHIWIRAITSITPETELVYDYRFEWDDAYEPEDVRYYACRCGSARCRGTILRVPAYLRKTVREWLAGNDVPKPKKPKRKKVKKVKKVKEAKKAKKVKKAEKAEKAEKVKKVKNVKATKKAEKAKKVKQASRTETGPKTKRSRS